MRSIVLFVSVFALMACNGRGEATSVPEAKAEATAAAPAAQAKAVATAADDDAAARNVEIDNDLYTLEYTYPAAAGSVPGVRQLLDADLDKRKVDLLRTAKDARDDAAKDGFKFRKYGLWVNWSLVTSLPDWVSLSAQISDYTGGAHPNHVFDALLWDRRAEKMRDTLELFTSDAAFVDAVRADFCKAIDKERTKRRQGEVMDMFSDCVDPLESTVILGSSNGKTFDRVGFLVPPYIAGPYAEGSYEVTLPVTDKLLALVKPEYRASFAVMKRD